MKIASISGIFFIISKLLFENIYLTSKVVVDEEFHLPLGEAYCKYEFHKWDPKVTTLPGLYLISALFLGPLELCSTYWLRLTSLAASSINIFLYYSILSHYEKHAEWKNMITSVNLAFLPPLYFFSHLYYTDVLSLTIILTMFLCSLKHNHYLASIFGFLSIIIRQTNIIFVAMVAGKLFVTEIYSNSIQIGQKKTALNRDGIIAKDFLPFLLGFKSTIWTSMRRTSLQFWLNVLAYMAVLISFVTFVIINGSIVVGDKTAHQVTVHLPQLFYFTLFCLVFAWPHFLIEINSFLKFARKHKLILSTTVIISIFIVYFNTLVHPYLLADNRHYTFYIWNRFYSRYVLFRYGMIFIYIFAGYVMLKKMCTKSDISFALFYLPCVAFVLTTQQLIEIRYYFVPYVLLRLQFRNVRYTYLILEFLTYCVLNTVTFYLFFNKTIQWNDFDYPQRIIW